MPLRTGFLPSSVAVSTTLGHGATGSLLSTLGTVAALFSLGLTVARLLNSTAVAAFAHNLRLGGGTSKGNANESHEHRRRTKKNLLHRSLLI
jgi:hypothetical protein